MYEDYGDQNGLLWGNVMVLDAPHNFELKGHLSPSFGGPAITFMKLSFNGHLIWKRFRKDQNSINRRLENAL